MDELLDLFNTVLASVNGVLWHPVVLWVLLLAGLIFTVRSRFSQRAVLTHGVDAVRGRFDDDTDPGAISHFQALSAALSATVGIGNIGGVALAIALGGPGAVFWMWVVGVLGMALKSTEVTLSMLYRRTDERENPHGGPMWVARRAIADASPRLAGFGKAVGGLFCVTLLVSALTGGNFFQAWNVVNITRQFFGVPPLLVGVVLAVLVGLVILGGIHRIGAVAGRLVPFMCGAYLVAGLFVIAVRLDEVPAVFGLIFQGAFDSLGARGAFLGGTAGFAFATGLQRAFFSNEAGQGSSPIAHSAARTREPAREGLVAGLEPFIDTLVVCTLTAMVILLSGAWNRDSDLRFVELPRVVAAEGGWGLEGGVLPERAEGSWQTGDTVRLHVAVGERLQSVVGTVMVDGGVRSVDWRGFEAAGVPRLESDAVFLNYTGAAFTAYAFDRVAGGLGKWLVTVATWLFALSTLISWSYYGEQGIVYLLGDAWVRPYRWLYCLAILPACSGLVRTATELNNLTLLGTGLMLWVNVPLTLAFAGKAINEQRDYLRRMDELDVAAEPVRVP